MSMSGKEFINDEIKAALADVNQDDPFGPSNPESKLLGTLRSRVMQAMENTCQGCQRVADDEDGFVMWDLAFYTRLAAAKIDPQKPLSFANVTCLCSGCDAERGSEEIDAPSFVDALCDTGEAP
jgi:hypothetical protein